MATYVAFLRAINVGGRAVIKMRDVQAAFASAGCRNVKTYIQSGNVVFDAPAKGIGVTLNKARAGLGKLLETEPDVIVRTLSQVEDLVEQAPFKNHEDKTDTKLYVLFLKERPSRTMALPLVSNIEALEVLAMNGLDVLVVSRKKKNGSFGFPNTFIEKELAVPATSRNWTTVIKLVEFARKGTAVVLLTLLTLGFTFHGGAVLDASGQGTASAVSADVAKLATALSADDVQEQLAAARTLVELGPGAAPAIGALIDVLKKYDGMTELTLPGSGDRVFTFNPVQTIAVQALAAIGEPAMAPIRDAMAGVDQSALPFSYFADTLAAMQLPAATEIVRQMLHSENPSVRRDGAGALALSRDPASLDALIGALRDGSAEVRDEVVASLEKLTRRGFGQDVAKWEAWRKESAR